LQQVAATVTPPTKSTQKENAADASGGGQGGVVHAREADGVEAGSGLASPLDPLGLVEGRAAASPTRRGGPTTTTPHPHPESPSNVKKIEGRVFNLANHR